MSLSIFDLFSIGIGPSSSHSVGPMRAAYIFINHFTSEQLATIHKVKIDLYGSLALTGIGHGTDKAVLMGLEGEEPATIDPESIDQRLASIKETKQLILNKQHSVAFDYRIDLQFHNDTFLPEHSNGMRFTAFDSNHKQLSEETFFSIGGGFILTAAEIQQENSKEEKPIPYPFNTAAELLEQCKQHGLSISELMLANEKTWHSEKEVRQRILHIADIMQKCIDKGCTTQGELPGILHVKRRASEIMKKLQTQGKPNSYAETDAMNWLNMYAMAVNEENAAGGRVVTAPTNGAAGIIPAVLTYYKNFYPNVTSSNVIDFLLTAGAMAILYKKGASISGAEVGCQGEVGVASSMAAAALTAVLGGTIEQIENAAEIAMEHHLGMTCDPVAGLVQIPCIERNAMGSVKAVNAMRLAILGDGQHKVSLDKVIATMLETGKGMQTIYKETSLGGLAVNVIEC